MSLRSFTTVVQLSCTLILVSLDHSMRISVWWFIYMLSSAILKTRWISHELSEYYYVVVNRYYSSSLHFNVNTSITGTCTRNCCTTLYEHAVQYRYSQPGKCYLTYPDEICHCVLILGLWSGAGHATCNWMLCIAFTLHYHSIQLQGVHTGIRPAIAFTYRDPDLLP